MSIMTPIAEDDVELVRLALPLDRDTIAWLAKLSANDVEAAKMIASILKEIRIDDELAHRQLH